MGCNPTSSQRSLNQGSAQIEFVTFDVGPFLPPFPGGVAYDIPLAFSKPRLLLGVCSIQSPYEGTNIFLHFEPTGLSRATGSIGIIPLGTERWIPLQDGQAVSGGSSEGRFIRFKTPIQNFYVSCDHPNGGVGSLGLHITLFGTDDVEDALLMRVS